MGVSMFKLMCFISLATLPLHADEVREIPKLSVTGSAEIKKAPDMVSISVGVEEEDKNADAAMKKTAAKIEAVIAAIKAGSGQETTYSTDTVSLYPVYEPTDPKKPKPPLTIGYRAASTLTVKTSDLKTVGKLIDSAAKAGANRIESLVFSLKDNKEAEQEALTKAAENALATAATLAKASAVKIKRTLLIQQDSGVSPVRFKTALYSARDMGESSMPIEPGSVSVSAQVSITFEIE